MPTPRLTAIRALNDEKYEITVANEKGIHTITLPAALDPRDDQVWQKALTDVVLGNAGVQSAILTAVQAFHRAYQIADEHLSRRSMAYQRVLDAPPITDPEELARLNSGRDKIQELSDLPGAEIVAKESEQTPDQQSS